MMYFFMLLAIMVTIILLLFYMDLNDKENKLYILFLIAILQFCNIALVFAAAMQPRAIDVYRGETTLKVEYVDGIAQDSVVVYKEKVHNK